MCRTRINSTVCQHNSSGCLREVRSRLAPLSRLEELADIDRLTRIFQGYFADHESCMTITRDDLHAMANERARACASKYREKLRLLHISHTDYYLDTVPRLFDKDQHSQRSSSASTTLITHAAVLNTIMDYSYRNDTENPMWSVSVV